MKGLRRLLFAIFLSGLLVLMAGFSACTSKQDSTPSPAAPQPVVLSPEVKQLIADEVRRQLRSPEVKQMIADEIQRESGKSLSLGGNGSSPALNYGSEPPLKPCTEAKGGSNRREGKKAAGQSETPDCLPQTDGQDRQ